MDDGTTPPANRVAGTRDRIAPPGARNSGGSVRNRSNLLVLLGIAFFVVGGVIVFLLTSDDDDGGSDAGVTGPAIVIVGSDDIPAGSLADELIEAGRLKAIEVLPSE